MTPNRWCDFEKSVNREDRTNSDVRYAAISQFTCTKTYLLAVRVTALWHVRFALQRHIVDDDTRSLIAFGYLAAVCRWTRPSGVNVPPHIYIYIRVSYILHTDPITCAGRSGVYFRFRRCGGCGRGRLVVGVDGVGRGRNCSIISWAPGPLAESRVGGRTGERSHN